MTHSTLTLYLAGRAAEAVAIAAADAEIARSSHDTQSVMFSISHLGLVLAGTGRYGEAARVFDDARQFGLKYGVLPLLARATSMSGGFHLSAFDYEGAEALQLQARELARSVNFAPSVVSGGIDLMLIWARRHEPGRAKALLRDTEAAAASTAGWHQWLWQLRLSQTRAELALARGELEIAVREASEGIRQSRARGRPKYEALGLVTRAHALHALGQTHDAIVDVGVAVQLARRTADPALLLVALEALLALDGNDALTAEAHSVADQIRDALPDDTMRRRFNESEVVQRIEKLSASRFAENT